MKKQNKQTDTLKRVTVIFGYALFLLLLITLVVTTIIPVSQYFFNPAARHFNVAIFLIAIVAGAVLPLLVSYVIGDRATHSKSKVDHHFNGVLFGIASYWLSSFFSSIGIEVIVNIRSVVSEPLATTIIAGWPVLAALVVMAVVAVGYVKNQKKQSSVLEYKPYQIVLLTGLIATFAYTLFRMYFYPDTVWPVSILSIVIPLALMGVSYVVLPIKNSSSTTRLTAAVVAVTFGYIAVSIATQLLPFQPYSLAYSVMVPFIAGVMVLAFYLLLARRTK